MSTYDTIKRLEAELAESRALLSRAAEAIHAAWDAELTGYENSHGEMIFFGDLIDDINDALSSEAP